MTKSNEQRYQELSEFILLADRMMARIDASIGQPNCANAVKRRIEVLSRVLEHIEIAISEAKEFSFDDRR
tara:strand:- start:249 stop:458 length:210 start_codon:yes stop_codon:yes gene_type:complete